MRYREHTFLSNPNVPATLTDNRIRLAVAEQGAQPRPSNSSFVEVPFGTPLTSVKPAVLAANPHARVVEVSSGSLARLCKWLGTSRAQDDFNKLMRRA